MHRAELLQALDAAIAAVRRLEADGLRTVHGAPAAEQLRRLREELTARRAEVVGGAGLDREWVGRTVRAVAQWIPDRELPLLARLGGIARAINTPR
jgi:hypothetical protein